MKSNANLIITARTNLQERLKDNPHRGVIIGKLPNGTVIAMSYPMGRSPHSRNRLYSLDEDNQILRTEAADESKVKDHSLIIYNAIRLPVVKNNRGLIVTNGAQTDILFDGMNRKVFYNSVHDTEDLLCGSYCEPDVPIFTPRISAVFIKESKLGQDKAYFSIIRPDEIAKFTWNNKLANNSGLKWQTFDENDRKNGTEKLNQKMNKLLGLDYSKFPSTRDFYTRMLVPGFGFLLTTYMPGFDELPGVRGEPLLIPLQHETLEGNMQHIWKALELEGHDDCRVALGGVELQDNSAGYRFAEPINKYEKIV